VLVLGGVVWLLMPHPKPPAPVPVETTAPPATTLAAAAPSPEEAPPATTPATTPPVAGEGQAVTGWADQEAELPASELKRLRGVGAWTGDRLTITVYNASSWRVTEIFVRTSRLEGDKFVDSIAPQRLLPAGGAQVDAAVGQLLNRVAPDRKRPGVNPADTGPFEATVGPQPAGYRWKIESARGYPPRVAAAQ
jgi:hypothetical protein